MRARGAETATVGSLLQSLVAQMGLAGRLQRELALLRWNEAVGAEVARQAWPVGFKGATLIVRARNSAWAAQLAYLKGAILDRLHELTGTQAVSDIQWVVGRGRDGEWAAEEDPPQETPSVPPDHPLPPGTAERLHALAAFIPDPVLRGAFVAAAAAAYRRSAWGRNRGWRPCPRCGILHPGPAGTCAACRFTPGWR